MEMDAEMREEHNALVVAVPEDQEESSVCTPPVEVVLAGSQPWIQGRHQHRLEPIGEAPVLDFRAMVETLPEEVNV